ncbi:MAG: hypothetical protein U1E06_06010 [Tabrizicola sp.]|uniref:hypothetical protein n=1 Tax=Tabrizicola sp. TaxID=2005166 RepID=UPI0027349A5D|nr:hypothetical protein [Tabrizicola sp.]MDP3265053.1 hypothetical protein [Tabrizicola sp.]MDP3647404.1 hypothetical protein [Paracoccaceae bacterium]MDZ4066394.1 hypothetical protein [Tabrizicola sp.]
MLNVSICWRGDSGATYIFDVFPESQIFNPVAGVYVLCRMGDMRGWEALLVAETENLRESLNQRASDSQGHRRAVEAGMTHIATRPIASQDARRAVASDLARGLLPRFGPPA